MEATEKGPDVLCLHSSAKVVKILNNVVSDGVRSTATRDSMKGSVTHAFAASLAAYL